MIGSGALFFQTMILFPWHLILSEQLNTMNRNMIKMKVISKQLNQQMDEFIQLEKEIQKKNQIIVNSSEQILFELQETEEHIQTIQKEYIDVDSETKE